MELGETRETQDLTRSPEEHRGRPRSIKKPAVVECLKSLLVKQRDPTQAGEWLVWLTLEAIPTSNCLFRKVGAEMANQHNCQAAREAASCLLLPAPYGAEATVPTNRPTLNAVRPQAVCSIIDSLFACVASQAGFSPSPLCWLRVLRILLIVPYIASLLVASASFSLASAVTLDLALLPPLLPTLTTFFFARPFRFPRPFLWQSGCHSFFGTLFLPPTIERAGLLLTCTETPERLFGRPYHSFIASSRILPPSAPSATESPDQFISRRIWKTLLGIWSITLVCVSHSRHLHRSRMLFGLSLPA